MFFQEGVLELGGSVSRFATFEAKVVIKAPLAFFWGEFFDANGIYVHGIGVSLFLSMVVVTVSVVLKGEEWVVPSFGDLVGSFPDMFEVECL